MVISCIVAGSVEHIGRKHCAKLTRYRKKKPRHYLFEHLTRRRIQPLIALALVIVLASGIAAVITAVEFQKHEIGWIFAQHFSAVVFGFVASFASSTRDEIGGEQSEAGQRNEVSSRK